MQRAEIFVAVLLLAIGVITIADSVRLGFGWGMSGPESGFFPFYLGAGTVVCSLLILRQVYLRYRKQGAAVRLMPEGALTPILWVLVPATVMIVISEFVGLHIAAALYLGFYMRVVGKTGWLSTIVVPLAVSLSLYIVFDKLFLVPLPQGLWGARLMPF
jgi:putative tricarboxylic transport membrane protein